ncbi:hypothetical protein [Bradyrhizobium sp. STM 3557]|uniref:hypothetical protein n=1 Tax=Bradyrhizobium sp. STM 3557 TaxID=578920 RepID=UPI003890229B
MRSLWQTGLRQADTNVGAGTSDTKLRPHLLPARWPSWPGAIASLDHPTYALPQSCQGFSSLSAAGGLSERFQRVSGEDPDAENGDDKRNRPEHELDLN